MLDVLIIAAYVWVIARYLLKAFDCLQAKLGLKSKEEAIERSLGIQANSASVLADAVQQQRSSVSQKSAQESSNLNKRVLVKEDSLRKEGVVVQEVLNVEQDNLRQSPEVGEGQRVAGPNSPVEAPKQTSSESKTTEHKNVNPSSNKDAPSIVSEALAQQIQNQSEQPKVNVNIGSISISNTDQKQQQEPSSSVASAEEVNHGSSQAVSVLLKQIDETKAERDALARKLERAIEENQQQRQKAFEIQQRESGVIKDYESLLQKIQNENSEHQRKMQEHQSTALELESLRSKISELEENGGSIGNTGEDMVRKENTNLERKVEELKSELEFAQSQIKQVEESEAKLREELQELSAQARNNSPVSITQVVNHPEYLRVKEKLAKYESGGLVMSSSRARSIVRGERTPESSRLSRGNGESRVSERRSLLSKYNSEAHHEPEDLAGLFSEVHFLSPEMKAFLLEEIRRVKKLPIKKTKQLFRLDKLSPANPHDFIDNIPNIVILIELTNNKVLAAFSQTAFSREDNVLEGRPSLRSGAKTNKAMILDLTAKLVFNNRSPLNTVQYDENALVWGKDELVIKNDEPSILYSEFGSEDGVYSDGKYRLSDLLGGSHNFERINHYEVHRVYIS